MVLEFLADGFEEIEALTPVDVLRRAGVEIHTVAVGKLLSKKVSGSHGPKRLPSVACCRPPSL